MWLETATELPESLFGHLDSSFEIWRIPDAVGYPVHVAQSLSPEPTALGPTAAQFEQAQIELTNAQAAERAALAAREQMLAAAAESAADFVIVSSQEMIEWIDNEIRSRAGTPNRKAAHAALRYEKKRLGTGKPVDLGFVQGFERTFGQSQSILQASQARAEARAAAGINAAADRTREAHDQLTALLWRDPEDVLPLAGLMQQQAGIVLSDDAMKLVHGIRARANRLVTHALDELEQRAPVLVEARAMLEEAGGVLDRLLEAQLRQAGERTVSTDSLLGGAPRPFLLSTLDFVSVIRTVADAACRIDHLPTLPVRLWEAIIAKLAPDELEPDRVDQLIQATSSRIAEHAALRAEILTEIGTVSGLALRQAAARASCYRDWLRRCMASARRFARVQAWCEASTSAAMVFDPPNLARVPAGLSVRKQEWAATAGLYCLAGAWWPNLDGRVSALVPGSVRCGALVLRFAQWRAARLQKEAVACAILAVAAAAKHKVHSCCWTAAPSICAHALQCAEALESWHANAVLGCRNESMQDGLKRTSKRKSSRKSKLSLILRSLRRTYIVLTRRD